MVRVVMPQFGETVTESELSRWLVSVGDKVVVDQPIAEISADKVDAEVVSSDAGIVTALLVELGASVEVGAPLLEWTAPVELVDKVGRLFPPVQSPLMCLE